VIIGDPAVFALESRVLRAYERLSFRALGSFLIHIKSQTYGVIDPDATMLANSFDEVTRRISDRGTHTASFASEPDAGKVADAFRDVLYSESPQAAYWGMAADDCARAFSSNNIQWAPDGDEAFDDGSFVLQFDLADRVRLIAFKCRPDGHHDPTTLRDLWMATEDFYVVLERWRQSFLENWASLPKVAE